MMKHYLPALSVALAALFFGIAFYIIIGEQPARLALADAPLLAEWKVSFEAGFIVQGSLAILAGLCGIAAWWFIRDWRFLAGGAFMLANLPWTLAVVAPINSALTGIGADAASAASRELIEQWARVHSMRAVFALAATLLFIWASARLQKH